MIKQDPLFKGMTRKATWWDIPVLPLFCVVAVIIMTATIAMLIAKSIVPYVAAVIFTVPVVGIMRLTVKHDDNKFRLIWLWCLSRIREKNFRFWKALSYGPVQYKKRSW